MKISRHIRHVEKGESHCEGTRRYRITSMFSNEIENSSIVTDFKQVLFSTTPSPTAAHPRFPPIWKNSSPWPHECVYWINFPNPTLGPLFLYYITFPFSPFIFVCAGKNADSQIEWTRTTNTERAISIRKISFRKKINVEPWASV